MVLVKVDCRVGVEYLSDIVRCTGVIERVTGRDRHELREPDVRVVEYRREEPEKEHEARRDVCFSPPGRGERRTDVRDLKPVEGDERHTKATGVTEELVNLDVVWHNPADPREDREGLEDVSREEIPTSRASESNRKEALTAHTAAVTHAGVHLVMQSVKQCTTDQVGRPDLIDERKNGKRLLSIFSLTHRWRLHEEAPRNPTNGKSYKLSRHYKKPLIYTQEESVLRTQSVISRKPHTAKVVCLIIVNPLNSNDVGL